MHAYVGNHFFLRASRSYVGNLSLNCRLFLALSMAVAFSHARATVLVLGVVLPVPCQCCESPQSCLPGPTNSQVQGSVSVADITE